MITNTLFRIITEPVSRHAEANKKYVWKRRKTKIGPKDTGNKRNLDF